MGRASWPLIALVLLQLVLGTETAYAQSNQMLDRILSEDELRFGSAIYLVFSAGGSRLPKDQFQPGALLTRAGDRLPRNANVPITLGQFAYLIQEVFQLPKGVWYRVFPGPRYATRNLAHIGIVNERAYPGMRLSGRRALRILGRTLSHLDGSL